MRRLGLLIALLSGACADDSAAPPPEPSPASISPAGGPAGAARSWFTEVGAELGLDFRQVSGATGEFRMPEIMGAGVALFDAEDDGDLDAYCVNGSWLGPSELPAPTNRYYRHDPGPRFVDATEEAGLGDDGYGMGVAVGDVDNDGDRDVLVTNLGPDRLYANSGAGSFTDATQTARVPATGWSSSAAFFDQDRDGFLDLWVVQYVDPDLETRCHDTAGRPDYCGPLTFPALPDRLLLNDRHGGFLDVSVPAGISASAAAGLGVVCADFDEDGWQDAYVANDAYANQLWINQQDGSFVDEALFLGVAMNMAGQPEAGMGVVATDANLDGRIDLFMTHLTQETNTLYLNQGKSGFRDATGASGLGPTSMRFTGFGTAAVDLDTDGDPDLVVLNGGVRRGTVFPGCDLPAPWNDYAEPNLIYENDGAGRFHASEHGGPLTAAVEISRGMAVGDVTGDGRPDLLVGNVEGPARLYRNDCPDAGHWLVVRCVHPKWKRDAVGARVELQAGSKRWVATIGGGGSYQSASEPRLLFGLSSAESYTAIVVTWPDGTRESFPGGSADRSVVLEHGSGSGGNG